jgi:hypothetical protein
VVDEAYFQRKFDVSMAKLALLFELAGLEEHYLTIEAVEEEPTIKEVFKALAAFYTKGGN